MEIFHRKCFRLKLHNSGSQETKLVVLVRKHIYLNYVMQNSVIVRVFFLCFGVVIG